MHAAHAEREREREREREKERAHIDRWIDGYNN
jgi:hypothetical protein